MKTTNNLQYIFSCLITHSYLIARLTHKFDEIHKYFRLSPQDEESLRLFLKTQGEKFLNAAILMEDKRWREILPSIKHVTALVSKNILRFFWIKYLESIKVDESIPKSTMSEAVNFLKYISANYNDGSILHAVIQYELAMNTVSEFDLITVKSEFTYPLDQIKNYYLYRIVFNPGYLTVNFNLPVSKIINDIINGNSIDMNDYTGEDGNEKIIFVKSRSTKVVKVVGLNPVGCHFFDALINAKSLGCWKKNIGLAFKSREDVYHTFIKTMIDIDLVSIEKIGGTEYVCQT